MPREGFTAKDLDEGRPADLAARTGALIAGDDPQPCLLTRDDALLFFGSGSTVVDDDTGESGVVEMVADPATTEETVGIVPDQPPLRIDIDRLTGITSTDLDNLLDEFWE